MGAVSPQWAVVIGGLCLLPAAASEVAAQEDGAVIVSARRRDESLKSVPIAVTSFSAEKLERSGAPDITSLQQSTPNLTLQAARSTNSTLMAFIRGVGQQEPLWGFEPGVGLYVDDVYIARPQGAVLDIYNVQRIEVLRGPQGTLYGRNTIGGAVKFVTRPLDHNAAVFEAKLNLGSYNQRDLIVSGSLPLGGTLAVGAAVARETHDGYGRNLYTGADQYNKDVLAWRVSADWRPTDAFSARLAYDNLRDASAPRPGRRETQALNGTGQPKFTGPTAAYGLPAASVYDTYAGIGDTNLVTNEGAALVMSYAVSDTVTVKSISAVREGYSNTLLDLDGTPARILDVPAEATNTQLSQELQWIYAGKRWQVLAGTYYFNATAGGSYDTIIGNALDLYAANPVTYAAYVNGLTVATSGKVRTQSWAAFFDASVRLAPRLSLSVGGRYTVDHKTATVYRANYGGMGSPFMGNASAPLIGVPLTDYTRDRQYGKFTPRLSLSYDLDDERTAYASVASGFKSGGFDMRGDATKVPATVNGYRPESMMTSEIGLKGSGLGKRLSFAADIFQSEYEDVQIARQVPVGAAIVSQVENAGHATMRGIEFEGRLRAARNLTFDTSLGYIDARYDAFESYSPQTGMVSNIAHAVGLQNTPKWTGSVGAALTLPLAGGRLVVTPQAAFRSAYTQFEMPNPLVDQGGYWLYNLGLNWSSEDGRVRIGVHGLNLTDTRYRIAASNFAGGLYGNSVIGYYGAPRTVTVSVQFRR